MPIFELIALLVFGLGAWLWMDSVKAREIAVRAAAIACAEDGCQLLDETVAIRAFRFGRDAQGVLKLVREYGFEFSETGDNRRAGWLILLGHDVEMLHLRTKLRLVDSPYDSPE